jgi:hypothetical protein
MKVKKLYFQSTGYISLETAVISLFGNNCLVFLYTIRSVCSAVRIEYFNAVQFSFVLLVVPLLRLVTFRPPTAEDWDPTQAIVCEICGRQSGSETGFSPSTSAYHCRPCFTNLLYSSYKLLFRGQTGKDWGPSKRIACKKIGKH